MRASVMLEVFQQVLDLANECLGLSPPAYAVKAQPCFTVGRGVRQKPAQPSPPAERHTLPIAGYLVLAKVGFTGLKRNCAAHGCMCIRRSHRFGRRRGGLINLQAAYRGVRPRPNALDAGERE